MFIHSDTYQNIYTYIPIYPRIYIVDHMTIYYLRKLPLMSGIGISLCWIHSLNFDKPLSKKLFF